MHRNQSHHVRVRIWIFLVPNEQQRGVIMTEAKNMNKRLLVISAFIVLLVPAVLASDILQRIKIGESVVIQSNIESILIVPNLIGKWVFNEPFIHSKQDFENYLLKNQTRLNNLNPKTEYYAVVTFSEPIPITEVDQLASQFGLTGLSVKYISTPEGSGQMPYPVTANDLQELQEQSQFIQQQLEQAKRDDPNSIIPEKIELFSGVIGLYVKALGKNLQDTQDAKVVLVDVGAADQLSNPTTEHSTPMRELYYEWITYGKE